MRSRAAGPHPRRYSDKGDARMTTVEQSERFTRLPDEETLAATVVALEEHGFSVDVVDDFDAAREAVLARIPEGSSVMINTSVTLQETGIAAAIDDGERYESARKQDDGARLRHPAARDKGDRRTARVRPRQRSRDHPRRSARHGVGLGQPARLLRMGCRQRHLRGRRAEARIHDGGGARA